MENDKENRNFSYSYSSKQQQEIKNIRSRYCTEEEDKMERLRRLDAASTRKGSVAALALGVGGTLILGVGMCCCLVWELFLPGIITGTAGIAAAALGYPVYTHITKKEREKIAPEIIRLSDELLK